MQLTANVLLRDPHTGTMTCLLAGSELPDWAEGQVGSHVLTNDVADKPSAPAAAERKSDAQDAPPPRAGAGSSRAAWAKYATSHGVHVDADDNRDDIMDACTEAGLPT